MDEIKCSEPGCTSTRKNHYWGAVKAHGSGWFEQTDGTAYCPDHVPDWVAEWRNKRKT